MAMVVADKQGKTLSELYATIASANEITEWLAFYRLQKETPKERKDREVRGNDSLLAAKIRSQFMAHNANIEARKNR